MGDQDDNVHFYGSIGIDSVKWKAGKKLSQSVEDAGLSWDATVRFIRKNLQQGILTTWRGHIQRQLELQGGDLTEIGVRLSKNRGVPHRWHSGETKPDTDTLLLAVAAFDTRLNGYLPRGREAVLDGMIHRLHQIRAEITKREPVRLDRKILACVHYMTLSREWELAQGQDASKRMRWHTKQRVAEIISDRVFRLAGYPVDLSARDLDAMAETWEREWLIFHAFPPFLWDFSVGAIVIGNS